MKIGIIVHSQTGNTLSVAKQLKESFAAKGHQVSLAQVSGTSDGPDRTNVRLTSAPDVSSFDALVFGAPVQGFALSRVMTAYLSSLPSLQGKQAALLTTQHLPFAWMGGNQTIRQMETFCETKGAVTCGVGIVHWGNEAQRVRQTAQAVSQISALF